MANNLSGPALRMIRASFSEGTIGGLLSRISVKLSTSIRNYFNLAFSGRALSNVSIA
jgi:hypothetical protein